MVIPLSLFASPLLVVDPRAQSLPASPSYIQFSRYGIRVPGGHSGPSRSARNEFDSNCARHLSFFYFFIYFLKTISARRNRREFDDFLRGYRSGQLVYPIILFSFFSLVFTPRVLFRFPFYLFFLPDGFFDYLLYKFSNGGPDFCVLFIRLLTEHQLFLAFPIRRHFFYLFFSDRALSPCFRTAPATVMMTVASGVARDFTTAFPDASIHANETKRARRSHSVSSDLLWLPTDAPRERRATNAPGLSTRFEARTNGATSDRPEGSPERIKERNGNRATGTPSEGAGDWVSRAGPGARRAKVR